MMLRAIDGGGRVHTALKVAALAAVVLMALLLSPAAALAQRMHGGGGAQWGGHGGGFHQFNGAGRFAGARPAFVNRGFHRGHRGHFGGAAVFGGIGFGFPIAYAYPYAGYPYVYDSVVPMPAYNLPPGQAWYCDAVGAYYPYVATCPGPWRPVPVAPPQ